MNPANQGFRTGQDACLNAVFGLKVDFKLSFRQRPLHAVGDGLLPQQLAAQLFIVDGKVLAILALDAAHGQQRPVAHLLDGDCAVYDGVNTPFHHDVLGVG